MGFFSLNIILRRIGANKFFLQKNTHNNVMTLTSKTAFSKKNYFHQNLENLQLTMSDH